MKNIKPLDDGNIVKLNEAVLLHTNRVQYLPGLEGQAVLDNIIYVGDRAGPGRGIYNLCHEICHFVEIDDKRMMMPGWGIHAPTEYLFGRIIYEPVTMQITEREMRACAY